MKYFKFTMILCCFFSFVTLKGNSGCELMKRLQDLHGVSQSDAEDLSKRLTDEESLKILEIFESQPQNMDLLTFLDALDSLPFAGTTISALLKKSPKRIIPVIELLTQQNLVDILLKKTTSLNEVEKNVIDIVIKQRWHLLKTKQALKLLDKVRLSTLAEYVMNNLYKHRKTKVKNETTLDEVIANLSQIETPKIITAGSSSKSSDQLLKIKTLAFYLENFNTPAKITNYLLDRLKLFDAEIKSSKSKILSWIRVPWLRSERRKIAVLLHLYTQNFSSGGLNDKDLSKRLKKSVIEHFSTTLTARWPNTWSRSMENFTIMLAGGFIGAYASNMLPEWTADPYEVILENVQAFDKDNLPAYEEIISEEKKAAALENLLNDKDANKNISTFEKFLDEIGSE